MLSLFWWRDSVIIIYFRHFRRGFVSYTHADDIRCIRTVHGGYWQRQLLIEYDCGGIMQKTGTYTWPTKQKPTRKPRCCKETVHTAMQLIFAYTEWLFDCYYFTFTAQKQMWVWNYKYVTTRCRVLSTLPLYSIWNFKWSPWSRSVMLGFAELG